MALELPRMRKDASAIYYLLAVSYESGTGIVSKRKQKKKRTLVPFRIQLLSIRTPCIGGDLSLALSTFKWKLLRPPDDVVSYDRESRGVR